MYIANSNVYTCVPSWEEHIIFGLLSIILFSCQRRVFEAAQLIYILSYLCEIAVHGITKSHTT